jgi:hypothetical protein
MLKHVNTVHKEVIDVSIFAWKGKAPLLRCPNCSLVVGAKAHCEVIGQKLQRATDLHQFKSYVTLG